MAVCSKRGRRKECLQSLVRKPLGEDITLESWTSIKINFKSLGCEDEDWV